MKNFLKKIACLFLMMAVVAMSLSGCGKKPDENTTDPIDKDSVRGSLVAAADSFAEWKEDKLTYTPSIPAYEVKSDLSNVQINPYLITEKLNDKLIENHFVVSGNYGDEYFQIYEANRYDMIPNFITTDSVLHTYHLYFDYLLRQLEENELYDTAVNLSKKMIAISNEQYNDLKGTEYEEAAKLNLAYFNVGLKLIDDSAVVSEEVKDVVTQELAMIAEHEGINYSIIFPDDYKEDYSQYIPRGHYTKSEKLKKYFKALMWYGRMTFRLKNKTETKSALLVISALEKDPEAFTMWNTLFEPINFFVGEPDDLSYYDYHEVTKKVFGENLYEKLKDKNTDQNVDLLKAFTDEAKKLRTPAINSMVVWDPAYIPNDRNEETMGFRVLGQRATVDAAIFQKLIYRDVEKNSEGKTRMLPKVLDIPAVLGSSEAEEILKEEGDFDYEKYPENFALLKTNAEKQGQDFWTKNLYIGWVNVLKTLLSKYGKGYPMFMQNKAWKLKELMTFSGSYTELKHDTILYAKQVYAEMGGGPDESKKLDDRGYVEPNPELYNKMKSLIQFTVDGLQSREILSSANKEQLTKLEEMVTKLRDISIKELENKTLTDEEYEFIRAYGGSLEHFWYETLSEEAKGQSQSDALYGNPAAIVADIATDPNGAVLEEGTGEILPIYVIVPIDGKLKVAKGGVFSHYEFAWPMSDRLTDEKWRDMVRGQLEENGIKLADWTKEFFALAY